MSFSTWATFAGRTRSRRVVLSRTVPSVCSTLWIATGPVLSGAKSPETRTPSLAIVEYA